MWKLQNLSRESKIRGNFQKHPKIWTTWCLPLLTSTFPDSGHWNDSKAKNLVVEEANKSSSRACGGKNRPIAEDVIQS